MCWPKNLLKTWAKFKPVTRHHSWQGDMSDFDMYLYIAIIMYYCWSSMIMSSYFNVFAPKNDKDLCWYRPKPHFARGVSKLLEGSVYQYFLIMALILKHECIWRMLWSKETLHSRYACYLFRDYLGIKPITLVLLAPCSNVCATGVLLLRWSMNYGGTVSFQ